MDLILKFIIDFLAGYLIIHCVMYKRKNDSKIILFSKDWVYIIILLAIASIILKING